MSQVEKKKDSAEDIIQKSVEMFGLTPTEISDRNEEWMRKNGYKKKELYEDVPRTSSRNISKKSKLYDLHKRLEILQREYDNMRKYYLETAALGSILIYENADFEREGMLVRKIRDTKNLLAGKTKNKK